MIHKSLPFCIKMENFFFYAQEILLTEKAKNIIIIYW